MITYDMFYQLFQIAVSRTLELVQEEVSDTLPKNVLIELAGFGQDSHESSPNDVLFYLYKDSTVPRIVDIGVKGIVANRTIVWIRPSGHAFTNVLNKTWNNPLGAGPFKSIGLVLPVNIYNRPRPLSRHDLEEAAPCWARSSQTS